MLPDSSVRLNKYISESGICSRREADRYIEQGNVFLNGKRATIGDQVKPGDVVKVNGQLIEPREAEDLVLIALNKPVGIVSTTEDGEFRRCISPSSLHLGLLGDMQRLNSLFCSVAYSVLEQPDEDEGRDEY